MKNLEKLSSKLLSHDELSKIKGGGDYPVDCDDYYNLCYPYCHDLVEYENCMYYYAPTCSPLLGYDKYCY